MKNLKSSPKQYKSSAKFKKSSSKSREERLLRIKNILKLPETVTTPPNVASSHFIEALEDVKTKIEDGECVTTQQCVDLFNEYSFLSFEELYILTGIANWHLQNLGLVEFP